MLKFIFRALKYRNYRLFFFGQGISLIGTWMQQVAVSWLVYRMTNSAFLLGVVAFVSMLPTLIFVPLAGVLADRWDRQRFLIHTQVAEMLQAFILAFLFISGSLTVWQIILLSFILGSISALEMPTRQAFVFDIVDKKEDLVNGIALNSVPFNGARLIGPSIAGVVVALFGVGICFILNGISYLAAIWALLAMSLKTKPIKQKYPALIHGFKEGIKYAYAFKPMRYILLFMSLISFLGMPYMVLMPIFAKDILHGGAETLGFLLAATGLGALVGALYMASRRNVKGLVENIPMAAIIFGLSLILFSLSRNFWLSCFSLFLSGIGMMVLMSSGNTILQSIVEDDKRGRVMSLFTLAFLGMVPFGSLLVGTIAHWYGAANTLIICNLFCVFGTIIFATQLSKINKLIHPVYIKMGIIPEVASSLQSVSSISIPPEEG